MRTADQPPGRSFLGERPIEFQPRPGARDTNDSDAAQESLWTGAEITTRSRSRSVTETPSAEDDREIPAIGPAGDVSTPSPTASGQERSEVAFRRSIVAESPAGTAPHSGQGPPSRGIG